MHQNCINFQLLYMYDKAHAVQIPLYLNTSTCYHPQRLMSYKKTDQSNKVSCFNCNISEQNNNKL